ncbi:MBL fold metallo-hydrolase [Loigolactobacillus zhaoyuanensis]|uniref:MBL fold metallo-hydrolase n=1 Tax=Loigolactobacillus zhaoyuanensis TaxID=2486017 RepID=UPI000F747B20|nr:MBL fold metallo-hydrolase [Loigolactobacillus zhaoyuanensis]
MKLTVLGMYGGYPYKNVGTSAYLVQTESFNLLLDCGSGALLSLQQQLDPLQLDAVLLSHYHYDHMADIGVLQYYWQLHQGVKKEPRLPIYGHTADPLHFAALTMQGVTDGIAYQPQRKTTLGPFEITFLPTVHPVPAYAVRIVERATGKVLVYTADTAYFDQLPQFAQHADLLITDTNFLKSKTGTIAHMTSTQSGLLAKDAAIKQLLISHLPQDTDLQQLQQETMTAAGPTIPVLLAQKDLQIEV